MTQKLDELKSLLAPAVESLPNGVFLWGIEFVAGSRNSLLRLYIDALERPVNLDDCEAVSREVSALLDVNDPISGHYTLEVSSPGLDRPLFEAAHYARFVGANVKLSLALPQDGRRRIQGVIERVEGDDVILREGDQETRVALGNVQKARLVPEFASTPEPAPARPRRPRGGRGKH